MDDLYIAGTGCWLPSRMSTDRALAEGLCDPHIARSTDLAGVAVAAEDIAPPEMAARAAATAVRRAGIDRRQIGLILHGCLYHQGHELWGAASYVQRRAVGNDCPAIEVRQVSNGGMAALHLASAYLAGADDHAAALVTTADRFPLPGFDRWRTDPGTVYADGGTAVVLSRVGGMARLRSLVLVSDPELEAMHRVDTGPHPAAPAHPEPLDLEAYKRGFLARVGTPEVLRRVARGQAEVVRRALAEAKAELDDMAAFVLPHFGRRRLETGFLRPLGIELDRTTWSWSRRVGHLGAGDQIAGLNHLLEAGRLRPGDVCLLLGVGAGFSWSGAVVEILEPVRWRP